MHDVLAHALTLMVVQAEAGLASNDPATVRASFESIGSTGRGALTELRRVLGALRPTATPSDLAPQPEIADIESLIEQARTSGMPTELNIAGDLSSTPRPVALAAYRIVQESLTNAIRHGGGGPARVGLAAGPRELRIRVDSSAAARPPTVPDGAGRGLQGMRERANALGGALTAGPSPEGGWRVEATLPLRDGR
jgi:signal transduction histidine kinase